jgi:adenylylsulfate kinase
MDGNVVWHQSCITMKDRNKLNAHQSGVIWFTGLSASGKSTIAHNLEKIFYEKGIRTYALDGDNVRHGLNSNLGFSEEDRDENLRRVAEVAKLFADAGLIVSAAFITPLRRERQMIREILKDINFIEVYLKCDLQECIRRDPKGLYQKALKGEIANYTGINAPYEEPESPDLVIDTHKYTIDESVSVLYNFAKEKGFLPIE